MGDIGERLDLEHASGEVEQIVLFVALVENELEAFRERLEVIAAWRIVQVQRQLLNRLEESYELMKQVKCDWVGNECASEYLSTFRAFVERRRRRWTESDEESGHETADEQLVRRDRLVRFRKDT